MPKLNTSGCVCDGVPGGDKHLNQWTQQGRLLSRVGGYHPGHGGPAQNLRWEKKEFAPFCCLPPCWSGAIPYLLRFLPSACPVLAPWDHARWHHGCPGSPAWRQQTARLPCSRNHESQFLRMSLVYIQNLLVLCLWRTLTNKVTYLYKVRDNHSWALSVPYLRQPFSYSTTAYHEISIYTTEGDTLESLLHNHGKETL